MNPTHVHLLITHLPIFGIILGCIVLGYALKVKSKETITAAYMLFIISAAGSALAYKTGEAAEETVEHLAGISESRIEEHEDAALFALITSLILGAMSLLAIVLNKRNITSGSKLSVIILVFALFSFTVVARTGYLGGQIMHKEIYDNQSQAMEPQNYNDQR